MPSADIDVFCHENHDAINSLAVLFRDYWPTQGFDRSSVRRWLANFSPAHWPIALKLAQQIQYYDINRIHGLVGSLHALVERKRKQLGFKRSSVLYLPFGRTEESGAQILRCYRQVNKRHVQVSQLTSLPEIKGQLATRKHPTVFFLDDFVGTGNQVCTGWREVVSQIIPEYVPCFLAVIAASTEGIRRIEAETPLEVVCVHTIGARLQLTKSACRGLSTEDRKVITNYCVKAQNMPLGFGNLGLMLSFAYGTPNNTISAIRGSQKQSPFVGLLPGWNDLP